MAGYDLGTATGKVVIESDTTGLDAVDKKVQGIGASSGKMQQDLQKVGTGLVVAGAGIAAGLALATKSAADFDQSLANISAVSGITGSGMDAVRAKALQLGKDTKFSAGEAAGAIEELSKAGLSMPDILNGAADATVALAAAGSISLPEAATIASNAMNQFSLKAQDMPKVADAIAGAANASAIDVGEFGMSLQQVGAVANLAGVSFQDTATAIALMGNAGIKGSDAGTSLKSMFQRLIPTTKEQKSLMAELGIITKDGSNQFFDASGKMKSLADVSQILQGSLKGMTAEQKQATLTTLFGSDAIRAAAVLTKEGSKGFNDMAGAMAKVSANDVAKTKMDTFNGSLEQLKGSLETAGITIGGVLLPAIRSVVDAVTGWINGFLSMDEGTQRLITYVAMAVGGFFLLGGGIIKVVGFFQSFGESIKFVADGLGKLSIENLKAAAGWVSHTASVVAYQASLLWLRIQLAALAVWQGIVTAAQWLWNAAMSANPIGLIIIAIAAFIAIIILLWNKNEGFRKVVLAVWDAIKVAIEAVGKWFSETLWPLLKQVIDWIVDYYTFLWNMSIAIWTGIYNAIKAAWDWIVSAVQTAVDWVKTTMSNAWSAISTALTTAWNLIKSGIDLAWSAIKTVVQTQIDAVKLVISTAWNAIKTVAETVWNTIKDAIDTVWEGIKTVVSLAVGFVEAEIRGWSKIIATVVGFFTKIKDGIEEKFGDAITWIKGVPGKVVSAIGNVASLLYNAGSKIIQGLLDGIKQKFEDVKNFIGGIGNWISEHKGPIPYDLKLLVPNGEAIMDGLRRGLQNGLAPLTADLSVIGATISPALAAGYAASTSSTQTTTNSTSVIFNNYNNTAETASDANARQLRSIRTVGMFG